MCLYTVKWSKFSLSNISVFHMLFVCSQFKCQTILFDPEIGPFHLLPLRTRVDLGVVVMRGYSAFPKDPVSLDKIFSVISRTLAERVS